MRGAILLLPSLPSWRGVELKKKKHGDTLIWLDLIIFYYQNFSRIFELYNVWYVSTVYVSIFYFNNLIVIKD